MTSYRVIGVVVLLIHSIKCSNETWFQGCFQASSTGDAIHSMRYPSSRSLTECSQSCLSKRYNFMGVQTVDEDFRCTCLNSTNQLTNDSCCIKRQKDNLPWGNGVDCIGVYSSLGPYLTNVSIETDGKANLVNKTVPIYIDVERAAALYVHEDDHDLGQILQLHWSVSGDGRVYYSTINMTEYVEVCHKVQYTFKEIGTFSIDITATNGLSTISKTFDLLVIYPAPQNLQVDIPDEHTDLPACIPSKFKVTENGYRQFAVFVNTTLNLEASVSMGTNLVFSFWFEDSDEESRLEPCSECTSVLQAHTFLKVGQWSFTVTVQNSYGWTQKNVIMIVVERQLSDLQIQVDPEYEPIATTANPIKYVISMVTTSRSNLSLQVWYGDGHHNTVSIRDTNFPALVLLGDGREMDIIADYGQGCELTVELEYQYSKEGSFKPQVAVFKQDTIKEQIIKQPRLNKLFFPIEDLRQINQPGLMNNVSMFATKHNEGGDIDYLMKSKLSNEVLIVRELTMAQIEVKNAVNRVAKCNNKIYISVKAPSRYNTTVHWTIYKVSDSYVDDKKKYIDYFTDSHHYYIDEGEESYYENQETEDEDVDTAAYDENDVEIVRDHTSTTMTLPHAFPQVGVYIVEVTISNAISTAKTSTNIMVQCPIGHLDAACSNQYIKTGTVLECKAYVLEGSDVFFVWTIEGMEVLQYSKQENYTSSIRHRFEEPGIYDVYVHAINNISSAMYEIDPPVIVKDPIEQFEVYKQARTLLGIPTLFGALHDNAERLNSYYYYCYFDFDFGEGRQTALEVCDGDRCYAEEGYTFPTTGKHAVTVYAYNEVSELSQTVNVWVYPSLDNVSIEVVPPSVVGSPTRFIAKENGETMVTDDVYFTWKTEDKLHYTNSPVFEATFTEAGSHVLVVKAKNPVVTEEILIPVYVLPVSDVKVQILHDLYVKPGQEVNFTLKGPLIGWGKLQVTYSDGTSNIYNGVTYRWSHIFQKVGTQEVTVTLLGTQGTNAAVTTYVMVQEPVQGLSIEGSDAVPFDVYYDTILWLARLTGGSNVVYRWTLNRTIITTSPEFETNLPGVGEYILCVEADNDVSEPIVAELPILIEKPINGAKIIIEGNLVGEKTLIQVAISGYHPFFIEVDFGDRTDTAFVHSEDFFSGILSIKENIHLVNFTHIYKSAGEFKINVTAWNSVSRITKEEVYVPITNITLIPKSPWLLRTNEAAKVVAIVTGGKDLTFTWNFSDDFMEATFVRRYANQTSLAIHPFTISGEYSVIFSVIGEHFPDPGVSVSLAKNITVVDPIDVLRRKTEPMYAGNSAAIEGNRTKMLVFGYVSSGSHVTFVFDFGDGTVSRVPGIHLSPLAREMTMYGEARHQYKKVGVYKVMVTAVNSLGNVSLARPHLFYVQKPPVGLQFCDTPGFLPTDFKGRVGQNITLCVQVRSGTNVTFDWKLGDQNDIVKAGPIVTHQYQTAKIHKLFVTAKNKVDSIERSINVDINHEMQGVDLRVDKKIVAVGEPVWFEAVVRPNYTNIVSRYQWIFISMARRSRSSRTGRDSVNTYKSGKTPYKFFEAGIWTSMVIAHNSISSVKSEIVDIEVQEKISKLEIVILGDRTKRLVGTPIEFTCFIYSGTNFNITWTFSDGITVPNTPDRKVKHTFDKEGRYSINLTATNFVSKETVIKHLFVMEKSYCNQPEVSLLLQNKQKVLYSKPITIEADVKMDCNLTSAMAYEWELDSIDKSLQNRNVLDNRRILVLPPGILALGLHKINFKVNMVGTIVHADASTYVEVTHTPLVSRIYGGLYRQIRRTDIVTLNGCLSYDPDVGRNDTSLACNGNRSLYTDSTIGKNGSLFFTWTCRYTKDDGSYGDSCFNTSCDLSLDMPILEFSCECLVLATNYTFELTVSSPGRQNDTSFQVLHMVEENKETLDLSILQPYSTSGVVNGDRKLAFVAECSNCGNRNIRYEWTLKYLWEIDKWSLVRAHDLICVDPDGATYLLILEDEEEEKRKQGEERHLQNVEGADTDKENEEQSETQGMGITENYSSEIGNEQDSTELLDQATLINPLQILEGDVDNGEVVNRRRRSIETTTGFEYPIVKEETDLMARGKNLPSPSQFDIKENTEDVSSRRQPYVLDTLKLGIKEGPPGESGSSAGRQLGLMVVEEGRGSGRGSLSVTEKEQEATPTDTDSKGDQLLGTIRDKERKYTILDQRPVPFFLQDSQTKTGLFNKSLVIKPGVLRQGMIYIVQVQAFDEERQIEGQALSSFTVNESPVYGRCSITPDSGVAMETEFNLFCKEWRDKPTEFETWNLVYALKHFLESCKHNEKKVAAMHQPLMYEVSYSIERSGEDRHLVYRGIDYQLSLRLPAGPAHNNYTVNVFIDILDSLLARTSVCSIALKVTPRNLTQPTHHTKGPQSLSKIIYDEVTSPGSVFHQSVDQGDDAVSKVYIGYLADFLNNVDNETLFDNTTAFGEGVFKDLNNETFGNDTTIVYHTGVFSETSEDSKQFRIKARTEMLRILEELPVRDEAELLQTAQALSYATAKDDELNHWSVDLSVKILQSLSKGAKEFYNEDITPTGSLIPLAVRTTASIVKATTEIAQKSDKMLEDIYKRLVSESVEAVEDLVLNELKYHVIAEQPISSYTDYFSVLAARHSAHEKLTLQIHDARFDLPENLTLETLNTSTVNSQGELTNHECYQSHMMSFKKNPYSFEDWEEVNSTVSGLTLYDCQGRELHVQGLPAEQQVHVELPNIPPQAPSQTLTLERWAMNLHQFNLSTANLQHSLHLVIDIVPVSKGRLFPITVFISHGKRPSPEYHHFKYDFEPGSNHIDIFFKPGMLNMTGTYYIGIVDSNYNAGHPRPGEITRRNYSLKLWWGQCLYWNMSEEMWEPNGCQMSRHSTYKVTKCTCNHLTVFGGRFELVQHRLNLLDVESLFNIQTNPITITLISIVTSIYLLLFVWCRHADQHDDKKGGIVYLLDNTSADQQKYEITVETGIRKGAGTTAKISMILHGEEGMSETRELISEDDRPMFERNSTDKFILTLPDSIGRIWKVQIWHNNYGESPSWYLCRVIVRDLNTGGQYLFQCDKWLAVEEQDGKVEREFMVQEAPLTFLKVFRSKTVEYMADLHVWLSLFTCPPYSGFVRMERLSVCLTIVMLHMCFMAVWYNHTFTEYRGEFGLIDVSWQTLVVGAMCCIGILPIALILEVLFRRSKPKHASSCTFKDESSQWDIDYPSGKPNEQESEDNSEHVPPVMTYSLLDQSILNWPNIQTWAQKQWMKRQQSVRSHGENARTNSDQLEQSLSSALGSKPTLPVETAHTGQVFPEVDQASSGFEDCSSLIRPKASVDSTHTTAAPSVAESMKTHQPQSPPDSLRLSKPSSVTNSVKTTKAPSISSSTSNKSSMLSERKVSVFNHLYLPYWCRYIAWSLCLIICIVSATVTITYGLRFGKMRSILWLQSLYFSCLICVFVAYPILVMIAVLYSTLCYVRDPGTIDMYSYDLFNREKAKEDLRNWKKQMELLEEGEALERGVAARQRSRYLRFARPPQEKQLIEARKRVMKEKKALTIFRESVAFGLTIFLLLLIAYGKDSRPVYHLNRAMRNQFSQSGSPNFTSITTREAWFHWIQTTFLQTLSRVPRLEDNMEASGGVGSSYIIGSVQLRQQRVAVESCHTNLPYLTEPCLGSNVKHEHQSQSELEGVTYTQGHHGNFIFGKEAVFDGSGYVLYLNKSRSEALQQIQKLQSQQWLDRQTRAVFVEFTLYNAPTNLFTAVDLLLEMSPTGTAYPVVHCTSTYLFRYVTAADNLILICEMLFFLVMIYTCKTQFSKILDKKRAYFTLPWNVLNFIICCLSLLYCACYIYRFVIMSNTVESLRSTYYEKYVDVSFITFWDEMLRSAVSILLFLSFLKCLRLLRYNKQFAIFGDVYRRARREVIMIFTMFVCTMAAYTSLGHLLFGCVYVTFRDILTSVTSITALMVGHGSHPRLRAQGDLTATNIFLFSFCIFGFGCLTAYMVAVLSHYFKVRRKRRLLAMGGREAVLFYWRQFQLWMGIIKQKQQEEEVIILPPEFTMAEIEYQVEELLFRMNALTGSHNLPEKPPCYLTDSDCTYGGGDDGISSAGSDAGQLYGEDRLEQRVQKIEDNLCSQEPFLAHLLKLDNVNTDDWSQEREKQLRSHLELEIFRQLQLQRQDLKSPGATDEAANKRQPSDTNTESPTDNITESPVQESASSEDSGQKPSSAPQKDILAKIPQSQLAAQILQDLVTKSPFERKEPHSQDNSSSNPDSPLDKLTFSKSKKIQDSILKPKTKPNGSSNSSSEKISPDLSSNHTYLQENDSIKKPTKPTFLHSRDSSLSETSKGSPSLKVHAEKGIKSESHLGGIERMLESSSGSEQDGIRVGRKMPGKRSLRKTKSRGKGKGVDSLEPVLILDELEGEDGEAMKGEVTLEESEEKGDKYRDGKEQTVQADVHHACNR